MYRIIAPCLLNEDSFEYIVSQIPTSLDSLNKLTIDLGNSDFIDPYGTVGVLELGKYLKNQRIELELNLPKVDVLSYILRLDFFKFAPSIFGEGKLPITKVPLCYINYQRTNFFSYFAHLYARVQALTRGEGKTRTEKLI